MKELRRHFIVIVCVVVAAVWTSDHTAVDAEIKIAAPAARNSAETVKPELVTQTGHGSTVNAVVFEPKSRWLATGSTDSTVIIWEAAAGRELRMLQGHQGAVRALACSPDGRLLASGGNDRIVRIWDPSSGRELKALAGHGGMIESLSFSSDGKFLASGSADNSVIVWDASAGSALSKLNGHGGSVKSLAFDPNGLLLTSGAADGVIKIWDLKKQAAVRTLRHEGGAVTALRYSSNGEQLASAGTDLKIRIWKTAGGRETSALSGHRGKILSLFFRGDGKLLSAGADLKLRLWDPLTGKELNAVTIQTESRDQPESAAVSEGSALLVIGNGNRTAAVFDALSGEKLTTFENQIFGYFCVSFSPDGRWLAAGSLDNTIKLWDLETGQGMPPLTGHLGDVTAIAFHPDQRRLISSSLDGTIRIWNLMTGEPPQIIKAHGNYVTSIAVSPDGRAVISGSSDRTVKIWDLAAKTKLFELTDYPAAVTSVAISPDGQTIAAGGTDTTIRLWNLASKKPLLTLSGHTLDIEKIAFSPDGRLIASGSDDRTVKIWDAATGRNIHTLSGHSGKINDLAFSADGATLASAGQDKTVRTWNLLTGKAQKVLSGPRGAVKSLAFSANGKWLASGGDDGNIDIRRNDTGEKSVSLMSLRDGNEWLVVTPQGLFDGSPASWTRLIWRFENDTFNVKPVEVFFNEFYYPGLLSQILSEKPVPQKIDISKKDRRQPEVKIERIAEEQAGGSASGRLARVKIRVRQAPPDAEHRRGSGARDIRIFRNGSLVKLWDGDALRGKGDEAELEAAIPLVYGQNQITAYAFNDDNIKSSDYILSIKGSENLRKKGILYIVGIAVGENANPNFALADIDYEAIEFARQLSLKQAEISQFERIETVTLINQAATKKNILAALKALTGNEVGDPAGAFPGRGKLTSAQPEDTVLIYFTGHGTSLDDRFYMLPYDLDRTAPDLSFEGQLKSILNNGISDLELRKVFKDIDANRLLLVIDACNSGRIIEADESRQGPMNARGLAQLAFDKGMFILTASQSQENAYVSKTLRRSYLTYALIDEGLKSAAADVLPADGNLSLREWFDYAVVRVPQLRGSGVGTDVSSADLKGIREGRAETKPKDKAKAAKSQSPRAFYRRQIESQPMIVARVGTSSKSD